MKLILDAKGLAEALSMPVGTVRQYANKQPHKLPPQMETPTRKLQWAVKDVEAWVEAQRQTQSA
jgi:predicted DNA-binding transcriptional regulator AlpA